ncbi:MAG TPA: MarR family winged helix-turn-helix transcriptional regulator [Steroidobacteraceae bacterium]|nr:MarR family winged helix-turn-helix transcriptional regulator [Bryobacteraceae bacterium]HYM42870.1 MarR family winged helix-turn-helix transcriptional regulator [Steroidobacteraceae bacterium]
MARSGNGAISKAAFERLSEFRYQMRRFQRFSEHAARSHGVTPLQYLLLLHIQGYPGYKHATVGELAERLQAHPHGVVALISRCERRGLVARLIGKRDRRRVEVHLRAKGRRLLVRIASMHRSELKIFRRAFSAVFRDA